jgi:hypothetical protein
MALKQGRLVWHESSGEMFDMLQLVGKVGKKRLPRDARTSVSQFRQGRFSQP